MIVWRKKNESFIFLRVSLYLFFVQKEKSDQTLWLAFFILRHLSFLLHGTGREACVFPAAAHFFFLHKIFCMKKVWLKFIMMHMKKSMECKNGRDLQCYSEGTEGIPSLFIFSHSYCYKDYSVNTVLYRRNGTGVKKKNSNTTIVFFAGQFPKYCIMV